MLTITSCRALAADDRVRATGADSVNREFLYRASAQAWDLRADMLERIGLKSAAPSTGRQA